MLDVEALGRKELQNLAKRAGIKANAANDELRKQLASIDGLDDLVLGSSEVYTKSSSGEGSSSEEGKDEGFDMLPRRRLQELAKAAGIKANLPTAQLIAELKKNELESKEATRDEEEEGAREKDTQELYLQQSQDQNQDDISSTEVPVSPAVAASRNSLMSEASFSLLGESPALSVGEMSRQVRRFEVENEEVNEKEMVENEEEEKKAETEEKAAAEPMPSCTDAAAPGGALQTHILDRVSQMRKILTKKTPFDVFVATHQPPAPKMSSPVSSSISSRLPRTPPAGAMHRHTASASSGIKTPEGGASLRRDVAAAGERSPAGTPSRRASSGHTPGLRLSLHETLAGHTSVLTPKRRIAPSPCSSHEKRRAMSIERRSIGSIVDDDAACLMEGDELDDVLSLSNLDPTDGSRMTLGSRPAAPAPAQAPLSPLTFPMAAPVNPAPAHRDSVPRSIVGAGVCNGVPSSSSGSAAQLMARLNSIKQTFSQVSGGAGGPKTPVRSFGGGGGTLARTPAKDTALERKCSEQEGFNMGHGQDSEVEVLMGKSDLPITPSNGMIGARNGFRPSLHEALTGGKMTPSRSRIFKVTPLKVLNSDGMSPTYGRSVKMTTSGSWQDSRHSVVEDRCREIADGRRAAVAAHRGI